MTAYNEALDVNDDIDDDINYDAHTDEVLNNNYVSDEQNERAFDCGIDLDEIQNIINLVESLDADSLSSVPSTISTATGEEQTYFEIQSRTSTHLSFAQMAVNQVISSNIQSSRSSFASFAPSTSEIISSTVIDNDKTLVDTTITPRSILLKNQQEVQEKEHKRKKVENL